MIIGISGLQGAGKDTLANILVSKFGYYKYNLAEPLYNMALQLYPRSCLKAYFDNLGIWDTTRLENQKRIFKETELSDGYYGRNLLQDLGDAARKSDNYIFCKLADYNTYYQPNVVIPDVRTKYELTWLRTKSTSTLIYLHRGNIMQNDTHETESYQSILLEASNIELYNDRDIKYLETQLEYYFVNTEYANRYS